MRQFKLNVVLILMAVASVVFAEDFAKVQKQVVVSDVWIRAILPVQKSTALYMTVTNNESTTIKLIEVNSDIAAHSMIHQTIHENGIAKMRHQNEVELAPGATIEFKPGGLHVMFMGMNEAIGNGDMVDVTLVFDDGQQLTVQAQVKSAH